MEIEADQSFVSIILTSYNHEQFIGESIESILSQEYRNFELYIIDDASSDSSWQIIKAYASKDPRIIPIREPQNMYDLNCSLPRYIDRLKGKYVAIAHSDDAWKPDKLSKQVKYLDSHDEVEACFTWVQPFDDTSKDVSAERKQFTHIFEVHDKSRAEWIRHFFFIGNCLCHPSLVIRKSAYREHGLFTYGYSGLPDFVKWVRLAKHTDLHIIEEPLTLFRVHNNEENTSGDNFGNKVRIGTELYFTLNEYRDLDTTLFFEAFPEVQDIKSKGGDFDQDFLFAKLCLTVPQKMHVLYGLDLLFNILSDEKRSSRIKKLYDYDERAFDRDKKAFDTFGVIPEDRFLHSVLYADFGQGFSEEHVLRKKSYITDYGCATIEWDLKEFDCSDTLLSLRFDPDNDSLRRYRIIGAHLDNNPIGLEPLNGFSNEGWDVFLTYNPHYTTDGGCQGKTLRINLQVDNLTESDLVRATEPSGLFPKIKKIFG